MKGIKKALSVSMSLEETYNLLKLNLLVPTKSDFFGRYVSTR